MIEAEYPWRVTTYNTVDDIHINDMIPQITDSKGECPNCQNSEGVLYVRQVVPFGPLHHFTDADGGSRQMYAKLLSMPCGVCRPFREPPPEPTFEREVWWND